MIAIYSGANTTITHSEIQAIVPELSSSDVLLVQMENNFDATHSIIKIAHDLGKRVILNPAPYSAEIIPSIPFVDVITPNETEPLYYRVSRSTILIRQKSGATYCRTGG
jgi:sugar/nucleoside kinase (ribokinase family)